LMLRSRSISLDIISINTIHVGFWLSYAQRIFKIPRSLWRGDCVFKKLLQIPILQRFNLMEGLSIFSLEIKLNQIIPHNGYYISYKPAKEDELYSYLVGICNNLECHVIKVGAPPTTFISCVCCPKRWLWWNCWKNWNLILLNGWKPKVRPMPISNGKTASARFPWILAKLSALSNISPTKKNTTVKKHLQF